MPGSRPFEEPRRRDPATFLSAPGPGTGETLVGGAPVSIRTLNAALTLAPRLAAVDGGADTVLRAGLRPDRVVGDMDSLSPEARAAFADRMHPIAEQDSTDFDKALRTGTAPWFLGVGFLGARLDHALACLTTLAQRRAPCVLLGDEDCLCVLPPRPLRLAAEVGARVSLWPLGPAMGRSTGLRWPVDGIEMAPGGRVGTSNAAAAAEIEIAFEGAPVVLILEARAVASLIAALDFGPRGAAAAPL
jgi:thiamine pyrophosphokinase